MVRIPLKEYLAKRGGLPYIDPNGNLEAIHDKTGKSYWIIGVECEKGKENFDLVLITEQSPNVPKTNIGLRSTLSPKSLGKREIVRRPLKDCLDDTILYIDYVER